MPQCHKRPGKNCRSSERELPSVVAEGAATYEARERSQSWSEPARCVDGACRRTVVFGIENKRGEKGVERARRPLSEPSRKYGVSHGTPLGGERRCDKSPRTRWLDRGMVATGRGPAESSAKTSSRIWAKACHDHAVVRGQRQGLDKLIRRGTKIKPRHLESKATGPGKAT